MRHVCSRRSLSVRRSQGLSLCLTRACTFIFFVTACPLQFSSNRDLSLYTSSLDLVIVYAEVLFFWYSVIIVFSESQRPFVMERTIKKERTVVPK